MFYVISKFETENVYTLNNLKCLTVSWDIITVKSIFPTASPNVALYLEMLIVLVPSEHFRTCIRHVF